MDAKKKTVAATERDAAARAVWWERITALAADRLVFVDETGSHLGLTPRYARSPRGERARGRAPARRGKNLTLVAALGHTGVVAALTLEGALDGAACAVFTQQVLAPQLRPGQVVIWDNVKPHLDAAARAAVEARACELVFLPAYSPDLSPVELAFSKVKEALRRAEARTRAGLEAAIGEALAAVTPSDAAGWFQHCGYLPQPQLT